MKKNSSFRLLLFIGIAIAVFFVMRLMGPEPPPGDPFGSSSKDVLEFRTLCDTLKNQDWNTETYEELKNKLSAYTSQKVFPASDGQKLSVYLDIAYAQTLEKACNDWVTSDGNSADMNLLNEMKKMAANPNCSVFVSDGIAIMQAYFTALGMPARVNGFLQQQFDQGKFDQLLQTINTSCNRSEISHFSRLQKIRNDETQRLQKFQNFVDTYNGRKKGYMSNPLNIDSKDYFREYCEGGPKAADILKYEFYYNDFKAFIGLC